MAHTMLVVEIDQRDILITPYNMNYVPKSGPGSQPWARNVPDGRENPAPNRPTSQEEHELCTEQRPRQVGNAEGTHGSERKRTGVQKWKQQS